MRVSSSPTTKILIRQFTIRDGTSPEEAFLRMRIVAGYFTLLLPACVLVCMALYRKFGMINVGGPFYPPPLSYGAITAAHAAVYECITPIAADNDTPQIRTRTLRAGGAVATSLPYPFTSCF